jgi:cellulose synthase operon protein C
MRAPALASIALLASGGAFGAGPQLEVEYGGCRDVVRGACVVDAAGELRLWVRTDVDAGTAIDVDGADTGGDGVSVQGGRRHAFAVARGARRVTVRATRGDAETTWTLALAPDARPEAVRDAAAALASGDAERARTLAAPLAPTDADALGVLGRVQNYAGETEAARATLREAVARHVAAGHRLSAVRDATVVAYSLMVGERRFGEARAVLDAFRPTPGAGAEERYFLAYFRGLLAYNSGDDRGTLRELVAAADQAARMGWDRLQLTAEQTLAVQLQMLGRRDDAGALMGAWEERLDLLPSDCERAMFLNNVGWTRLLALEAGERADDPLPPLEQAYALFAAPQTGGLCGADEQVNGLLNLALAHLHAGRADAAAVHLERAHRATETPQLRMVLWSLDIEARLALLRDRAEEALLLAERLRELGAATASPDAVWRGVVRGALAQERLGRRDDALAAYAEGERLLDERLFRVPASEGRETLVAAHAWAVQRHVALLLEAGRDAEALALARSSTRALRSLRPSERVYALEGDERARWDAAIARYLAAREELTALARLGWMSPRDELERVAALGARRERELDVLLDDALAVLGPADPELAPAASAPADGTVELAFHRVPGGWATFVADAQGVRTYAPDCGAARDAALARCLLAPAASAAAGAVRIRILAPEELRDVDFHALDVGGDALVARAPVVYGLGMPAPVPRGESRRALLVGDAQGNLVAAQEELRAVRDALGAGDWRTHVLSGADASLAPVRASLAEADLFHYAGHARALGARGWDSELQLGARTSLDVSDILALGRAPDVVVLSGCETAADDAASAAGGISLAHAFVASGARVVVATTRPVRDATALAVMRVFYDEWLAGAPPETALQRAQLALRRDTADADWSAFRVLAR